MDYPDLPSHITNSNRSDICPGSIPSDLYEDVGLTNCICNECSKEFVWVERTKKWVESEQFEHMLEEANNAGAFAQL
jgi:hypothetical protein